ncbi:uncharacterized protein OCT59_012368 [Rhizophagus irregularis]|uniref:uncharacterized protein n=1 Tax=Rhizophagus irregularis TaxID=588596 RepID=UPI0033247C08|nr:hypothetical protein OCT59_012368 [Rhizophagus irregularis]
MLGCELNRPTVSEISKIIIRWYSEYYESNDDNRTELVNKEELLNYKLSTKSIPSTNLALSYEIHSEVIYR